MYDLVCLPIDARGVEARAAGTRSRLGAGLVGLDDHVGVAVDLARVVAELVRSEVAEYEYRLVDVGAAGGEGRRCNTAVRRRGSRR
jgi:hypothetical protein